MAKTEDIKTTAYVLRRTNYGETDRILNLITPVGKLAVIAKGVRKEKSKLAGGIEMFSLSQVNVHTGHSRLGILTSAKMLKYHGNLLKNLSTLELAGTMLKKIARAAESSDNPEYFQILDQSLEALNSGLELDLVETWFLFNFFKATGEQINLYHDIHGQKLEASSYYNWNSLEKTLAPNSNGQIGADEIKLMRLILNNQLLVTTHVKNLYEMLPKILDIAHSFNF